MLGLLKNEDLAKELMQELYLKLHKNRKTIKEESVRFYFFVSAKNICLDWFRKNAKVQHVEFSLEHEKGHHSNEDENELHQHFRQLIEELPPKYREVIYLKDVCGLETYEIMEVTAHTENNVRVLLSRARAKVKDGLDKIYNYEAIRKS